MNSHRLWALHRASPNPSIEGTSTSKLRLLAAAPHVKRVTIPRQSRGLSDVSRSKRLEGVADAAPHCWSHLIGGCSSPQAKLLQSFVLLFLISDVVANHGFLSAYR